MRTTAPYGLGGQGRCSHVHNSERFGSMPRVANIPRYALHVHNASRRVEGGSYPRLCTKPHINTISAMVGCMRLVKKLAVHSHEILHYLSRVDIKSIGSNFAEEQVREEVLKAKKIVSDGRWRQLLITAEKIACLKGKLAVLFSEGELTTWEQFDDRLNLLLNILEIAKKKPYYLQKVLLSRWDAGSLNVTLDLSENDSAKKGLLTGALRECFKKVLDVGILKNAADWVCDLCQTKLLSVSRGKVVSQKEGVVVLWGTSGQRWNSFGNDVWGNVILGNRRAQMLKAEGIRLLDENLKVGDAGFVSGKNIEFSFDGHWFQWWGVPKQGEFDVYLLRNDWGDHQDSGDIWLEHPEELDRDGDAQTLYCFRVEKTDNVQSFKRKLRVLIDAAEAPAG